MAIQDHCRGRGGPYGRSGGGTRGIGSYSGSGGSWRVAKTDGGEDTTLPLCNIYNADLSPRHFILHAALPYGSAHTHTHPEMQNGDGAESRR